MVKNNYVFLGTPDFAAIVLKKLLDAGMPPKVVICNPDRPIGRKKVITPPPTKVLAEQAGIHVWQPEKLTLEEWKKQVGEVDFAVVAAYAKIIKSDVLALPRLGFVGTHPSLLPEYRGATPIQSVLLDGADETGVTLYLVDEMIDHGPILTHRALSIGEKNYKELETALAELGGELLAETLPRFITGEITPRPQREDEATFTKKFVTEDGFVDLEKDDSTLIHRKIRALNPEPGVYTTRNGKRMKLLEAHWEEGKLKITKTQMEGETPKASSIFL